jgi:protoheme ferro-lyase
MQQYILYHTSNGKIESVLKLSDSSKQKMLDNNTGIAFLQGSVADVNNYQVNVNVDPHVIESKPALTIDIAKHIRIERLKLLQLCDWTQTADSPLSDTKKAEWQTYRQALRDLPSTNSASSVDDIVWPTPPE